MRFFSMQYLPLFLLVSPGLCKHVVQSWSLSWQLGSPDGNPRYLVHVNDQFPGPELRLDYGDSVEIHVQNRLPVNATVHFHGIEQKGTPISDGVPGLSQTAIQPGEAYTYRWTATQYGSYWYHGHYSGLIADGLFGAIYIKPPVGESRAFNQISSDCKVQKQMRSAELDSTSVLVSDWSKFTSHKYFQAEKKSGLDLFCQDSILVNGKGAVNCQTQETLTSLLNPNLLKILQQSNLAVSDKGCTPADPRALDQGLFPNTNASVLPPGLLSGCTPTEGSQSRLSVDPNNGWAAFNFISALSSKSVMVSIDEHPVWVYAIDGQYIQPRKVDAFPMYNGERYSVLVQLDKPGDQYTIRIANFLPDQLIAGYATMEYQGQRPSHVSTPYINYAGNAVNSNVTFLDTGNLRPFNQPAPPETVDATYVLSMGRFGYNWQWTLNNVSTWSTPHQNINPPLLYTKHPATAGENALVIRTKNDTWVDVVLQVTLGPENPAQPPHPTHKHGNKAYVIGSGTGLFNYSTVAEAQKAIPQSFNIPQAVLRDTFTTPAVLFSPAWVAFRYHVVNPGAWLLHCHISTHLDGGMAMAILDGIDQWPSIE